MPSIHLTTFIAAPVERVYDLSRHVALYRLLFQNRKESFSSGAAGSLLTRNETVSIVVKHAGKSRMMMIKITDLKRPQSFTEVQVKGDLENFKHEHHFKPVDNGTILIDMIDFEGPRDVIGKLIGRFYLKDYLERFLQKRNTLIQQYAESEKWRAVLT